jgi:hypothetical protein
MRIVITFVVGMILAVSAPSSHAKSSVLKSVTFESEVNVSASLAPLDHVDAPGLHPIAIEKTGMPTAGSVGYQQSRNGSEPIYKGPTDLSDDQDRLAAVSGGNVPYTAPADEAVYISESGKFKRFGEDGGVEFNFTKGELKSQLVELLLEHPSIDSEDDIQWQASENYRWANTFKAKEPSIDHLLEKLGRRYRLTVTFTGSGSVVVRGVN